MKEKRDKSLLLMRFWTVLIPSLFFSYVTDTLHLAILCIVAGILNFLSAEPVKITLRSVIYSVVISLTIIVLSNTIFKIEGRFYLTPSEMGIPTALVFAMALLFFDDRPTFSASILILAVFSIMMCGDITNPHIFKNLPLSSELGKMEFIHFMYVVSLLFCIIPFFYLMNRSHNKLLFTAKRSVKLIVLKFVLVAVSLASVFMLYRPTQNVVVPFTKNLESKMVRALSQWRFNRKKTAFQQHVNLRDSYFNFEESDLDTILMRVESKRTPGYIRNRVYETYKDGVWGSKEKGSIMNLLQEDHEYSFNTYSFNGLEQTDRTKLDKLQIYYTNDFKVQNIAHQGKTRYVEMTCETLNQTISGSISGKQIDFSGGITLYNDTDWSSEDAFNFPKIDDSNRAEFTQMPDLPYKLRVKQFIYQVDLLKRESDDPKIFAAKIVNFFNEKFTYKLGVDLDRNDDPVFAFLAARKGHCELFASTTVMFLRSQDIPARYVTGFYCQEEHPGGDYYIGRSKDLHAWVEFYDDQTEQWYLLEPTPANGLPQGKSSFNYLSSSWDAFKKYWQDLMSSIVRGYFAESILLFLKGILDLIIWCFSSVLKSIISLSLIYLWFYWRKKRKKNTEYDPGKEITLIRKDLDKILNKLSKIKELKIKPSMTIRDIIQQVDGLNKPQLESYTACLKEYESIRYNAGARTETSINEMKSKISQALKTRI